MQRTIPSVEGGRLYHPATSADPIVVGTSAWYDWLEHHASFLFVDHGGTFTARKVETESSDLAWEALRTRQGKRYRVQLGPSHTLTLARLQAAAHTLATEPAETSVSQVGAPASIFPAPRTEVPAGSTSSLMQTLPATQQQ
jgi:hypothetical protein